MATCGKISANQLLNCVHPIVGGVNGRLILINLDDWNNSTITVDVANSQLITGITLASGITAYQYEGKNNSNEPQITLQKLRYNEVYDHEVMFKLFYNSAAVKSEIEKLPQGKYVAIIENNFKGDAGECSFEVYGRDSGMEVQELTRILADADTQSAYNLILRSSEYAREGHLPSTLYLTSYAITKAIVDSLLV